MAQVLKAVFVHGNEQRRLDYTNATSSVIACGDVVVIGGPAASKGLLGICTSPEGIDKVANTPNNLGALATKGVFRLLKLASDTITFALGAKVFWDTVNLKCVTAAGANIVFAGLCVEIAAASGDDGVRTLINEDNIL